MFYAMLALGSRTRLAVLAETAAMLPMCALLVFSVYRLGRTFFGDVVGGFASLLLFLTPLFGYAQGMRGTALVFVLVGVGLGFFLDPRHSCVRMTLGALLIGTSVAVQAPIGAFAIVLAGAAIILWLTMGDVSSFVAGGLCLVGAVLFGAPEIPVGLNRSIPWVILPLCQLAGVALILIGVRRHDAKALQNVRVIRVCRTDSHFGADSCPDSRGRHAQANRSRRLERPAPVLDAAAIGQRRFVPSWRRTDRSSTTFRC